MNASDIQDALTLLPPDLILATDRLRTAPKQKRILWKHLVPMAACLVLLLSAGLVYGRILGGIKSESMAEAPAAALVQMESAADTAASQEAPAADVASPAENGTATEEDPLAQDGDHRHDFAEDTQAAAGSSSAWCGNTQATIILDGQAYPLVGSDASALTAILIDLNYDPSARCRCMAEFAVDTELLAGIEVSLGNAFARCEPGQASLTEQQVAAIREILDRLP